MWERDELDTLNARLAAMSVTEVKPPDGAGAAGAVAPRRFAVVPLAECRADRGGGYIVKGLLGPRDLALIIGQPGAGKSLFAPYLAHAVASGRSAFGRKVRACPVLYIAAEAGADVEGRMAALREAHGPADGLHLIAEPVNLRDLGGPDHAGLREAARAVGAGVIFVDTLAAAFPGLVENEAGPMGGAVRSLTGLGEATDAAVVAVHHTPKSGDTPRGHSVLNAAADVTLRVEGEGGGARAVRMGKNRNGASDAALGFRLRLVDLGHDAEGDPIVKPIAEELDGAAGPERPALTEAERRALDMLASAIAVEGTALPRGSLFPTGLRGVPERRWREECATRRLSPTDTAEAQRKAFDRAFKALLEKRVVAARDDLVWIARHPADGHGQQTDTSEPVRPGNPGWATDGHGHPPKGCPVRPARRSPEREAGAQRGR